MAILFVAITLVVFINTYLAGKQKKLLVTRKDRYRCAFRWIGWSMVATLPAVLFVHHFGGGLPHAVLIVEAVLLFAFALFWAIQTVELWDVPSRMSLIPWHVRRTLAPP